MSNASQESNVLDINEFIFGLMVNLWLGPLTLH